MFDSQRQNVKIFRYSFDDEVKNFVAKNKNLFGVGTFDNSSSHGLAIHSKRFRFCDLDRFVFMFAKKLVAALEI